MYCTNRYIELSASHVSDALDSLGIRGGLQSIYACTGKQKILGPAFTVERTVNCDLDYCEASEFIDQVPEGFVIVIDNCGISDSSCWGGILTAFATQKQIQGTVINGVHRDTDTIRDLSYPVFSKGTYMVTGKGRTRLKALNSNLCIGGVEVRPFDLIVGDSDGVVVVPFDKAEKALNIAGYIYHSEKEIERLVVEEKYSLQEARRKMKYNELSRMKGVVK